MTEQNTHPANGGAATVLERPIYDPKAPSAIEVEHIVKKYGDFTAVDDVSFAVKEGEIFGLLGPNGAGKSTLAALIARFYDPFDGSVQIDGHDATACI